MKRNPKTALSQEAISVFNSQSRKETGAGASMANGSNERTILGGQYVSDAL